MDDDELLLAKMVADITEDPALMAEALVEYGLDDSSETAVERIARLKTLGKVVGAVDGICDDAARQMAESVLEVRRRCNVPQPWRWWR